MDERRMVRISKYLAAHLRHQPEAIGLELDPAGWVGVDTLLAAAKDHGFPISLEELDEVVARNDKRRYVIQGGRIRASQGHSVPVELGLSPVEPPGTLYHGTVAAALPSIREQGLAPMSRHHVHLSPDPATATRVGSRRGAPVVLTVDAGAMHAAGHEFYRSENGVWLVAHVPPSFVGFPGLGR
ncbi:RNA 2'-phosphotransferase [Microbispora sp. NPDC049125]|uniref:RNA 2'-phosphotransferase n=1 Tax=Microbispora sp. NPDC049125 TaxID=3154929 RepID=UPI003464F47F